MTERWMTLEAAALRNAEIDVRDLDGTEQLNELFSYRVALTLRDDVAVEERAEQLLEQVITLRFLNGDAEARRVNGIVSEVNAKRHLESGLSHLELEIVPRAWLLGQRFGAELFLNKSVPDTVFFHDRFAKRMANARCRVFRNGVLVSAPKNADADGSLKFEVPADTVFVALEWAPANTPRLPHLPFRKLYRLAVPEGLGNATDQRLQHLGYDRPAHVASKGRSLSRRITFFQADYGLDVDGRVDRVFDTLASYHDEAQLPELPPGRRTQPPTPPPAQPVPPLSPDIRPPAQGAVAVLQPSFPRGGLTVSSASGLSAQELILFIQSELRLPRWFRDCLELGSPFRIEAHIALDSDAARKRENDALKQAGGIDDKQIECLDAAIRAIQSDKWHISTGALRELFPETFPGPMFMATGIAVDDPPVNSGGPVVPAELSAGEAVTMPTLAVSTPGSGQEDYHVDPKRGGSAAGQREPHRGFIWLSNRVQARNRRTGKLMSVDRSVLEVAEQFVHELACHADLINEGKLHEATHPKHPPLTEADRRLFTINTLLPAGPATEVTRERLKRAAEVPEASTPLIQAPAAP